MANKIIPKRSSVSGKVPATTDLDVGEIAVNLTDRKIYTKDSGGTVVQLGGGAGSGDVVGPNSSTDNAIARFDLATGKLIQNSSATIDDSGSLTATSSRASGTGANKMPVGTTAQRPTGEAGAYRMNSTTGEPEWYDTATSTWVSFAVGKPYGVEYLVVGGGGGGGIHSGGGGGAGGYIAASGYMNSGSIYNIQIGGGGAAGPSGSAGGLGSNGGDSFLIGPGISQTAVGGGGGNWYASGISGGSGGSGGGGSRQMGAPGSGTSGQGYAGGYGSTNDVPWPGGGGGGANQAGGLGAYQMTGGAGKQWVNGSWYAGGGGGNMQGTGFGEGGLGGTGGGGHGGDHGTYSSGNAGYGGRGQDGAANTGGGGGGSGYVSTGAGGAGGSGIVIIRYAGARRGNGGTVTSAGGYTYHTFTSSGTFIA